MPGQREASFARCAGYRLRHPKDVDGRDKPGHGEFWLSVV